ncbi:pancortin-3 [Vibrio sp. J2-4]|uniref:Cap15 family cyclic dinucleotide receptor domain-containing protein n=1 Tax=Vibrio sp. J2-4 TaxID=1507977 RepID=UPI001F435C17|nr:pancortin-3 [Vibrio sp. J2-4]MCF7479183.1 pancortin-3 [Vibrio sp. J2-4]
MHDYGVFGHDRVTIGRWLGVGSILVAGGLSQVAVWAASLSGVDAFLRATLTTGAVYFGLHWLFNKYAWKIPFFDIPDLSGHWEVEGRTLDEDGSTRFDWVAEVGIAQDWKQMAIHLKTERSQSDSYTAILSKRRGPTGGWRLTYSYRNEPEVTNAHELSPHRGYCEVDFDRELTTAQASYFNSAGRRTFGSMKLRKKND